MPSRDLIAGRWKSNEWHPRELRFAEYTWRPKNRSNVALPNDAAAGTYC
jgi:hypothetical protein